MTYEQRLKDGERKSLHTWYAAYGGLHPEIVLAVHGLKRHRLPIAASETRQRHSRRDHATTTECHRPVAIILVSMRIRSSLCLFSHDVGRVSFFFAPRGGTKLSRLSYFPSESILGIGPPGNCSQSASRMAKRQVPSDMTQNPI
jgi:hypothetical protein